MPFQKNTNIVRYAKQNGRYALLIHLQAQYNMILVIIRR